MRYSVTVEDIKRIINIGKTLDVDFLCNDKPVHVKLARQKTGFGYKVFMVCPRCGSRRTKLYSLLGDLVCRDCFPLRVYKTRQDTTDGGYEEITYRMNRLALKYGIRIEQPFSYYQMLSNKPKYTHNSTWERLTRQLQVLANMRFQAIFIKKKYSPDVIQYVLKNCLYMFSLYVMDKYIIDWNTCITYCKKINEDIWNLRGARDE